MPHTTPTPFPDPFTYSYDDQQGWPNLVPRGTPSLISSPIARLLCLLQEAVLTSRQALQPGSLKPLTVWMAATFDVRQIRKGALAACLSACGTRSMKVLSQPDSATLGAEQRWALAEADRSIQTLTHMNETSLSRRLEEPDLKKRRDQCRL